MQYDLVKRVSASCLIAAMAALAFATLLHTKAQAQSTQPEIIDFHFVYLPGLLEKDGKTGAIAEVIHEIGQRAEITFNMMNVPVRRSDRALYDGTQMVAGPELESPDTINAEVKLRTSLPIAYRRDFAFVRSGIAQPATLKDMMKLKLVVSPTTSLPPQLDEIAGLSITETRSDQSAVAMLSKGRVDLWVNDETTALAAIQEVGASNITYDPNRPVYEWPARIVFSTACSDALVELVDQAILSMIEDGTMTRLLPNNYSDTALKLNDIQPAAE